MATKRRPLAGWPAGRSHARRPGRSHAGRSAGQPVRPLAGRPVMITGAASGIGRSLARRLSGLGSPVAIADIDEAGLKETAQDAAGAGAGPGARRAGRGGPAPLRGRGARVAALAGRAAARTLAAVFNNAGVAVASSVLDADPDDDEWLRQINFDGVVNGTRAFLPILVEQDEG